MKQIDVALKLAGNVFEFSSVINTETGAPLPWPTLDDSMNQGELTAEGANFGQTDMTFGKKQLSSYKYESGFIQVSYELMTDQIVDLTSLIAQQSGIRIGRKVNSDFLVTGAGGTAGPTPIISTATLGATTASPTAVVYGDLNAHYHSVDPLYRQLPSCAWVYSDNFATAIDGLVDTAGRTLVHSSLSGIDQTTAQPTLLGKKVYINQALASIAATAKVALFGALEKIIVRRVSGGADGGLVVQRFNELFAAKGFVGFLAWMRTDCLLSDAGEHPVRFLQMHA
jgi:HK97 family phage major capsid protein